ncbi:MAG: hypothetical protein ACJAS4_001605 [Bacteriovoracaceae bacterium]|jgi:hypothetical protein
MEKSLIIILTFSFLISACGKKNDSGSKSQGIIEKSSTSNRIIDPNDFDGDMIENSQDTQPYIAQIPKAEDVLQFKSKDQILHLQQRTDLKVIKDILLKDFYGGDIKHTPQLYHSLKMKSLVDQPNLQLIANKKQGFSSVEFTLSNDESSLFNYKLIDSNLELTHIPAQFYQKSPLLISINNYELLQGGKLTSYKELLKNIMKSSYRLTIIHDGKVKTFLISSELSIEEGLEKVGLSQVIYDYNTALKYKSIYKSELIPNQASLWKLLNVKDQSLTQYISPGKQISIVKFTKVELSKNLTVKKDFRLSRKKLQFEIPLNSILGFKFNFKVWRLELKERKVLKKFCLKMRKIKRCTYYEHSVHQSRFEIKPQDFDLHFKIFLDNIEIPFQELKNYKISKYDLKKIVFQMINSPQRKLKSGFTAGKNIKNGEKVNIKYKKTLKIVHKVVKDDPILEMYLNGTKLEFKR